jgi:hypothetical protein
MGVSVESLIGWNIESLPAHRPSHLDEFQWNVHSTSARNAYLALRQAECQLFFSKGPKGQFTV